MSVARSLRAEIVAAMLCLLALQPIYLLSLVAVDYVAPPAMRAASTLPLPPLDSRADDTGECVALGIGLKPGRSAVYDAIRAPQPILGEESACHALAAIADRPDEVQWREYSRYWHGYRAVLSPLVTWLTVHTARYVMLVALIAALTWFAVELRGLAGYGASVAVVVPTVVLTDVWRVWQYTVHALAITFIFAGAAFFATRLKKKGALIVTAAILGSIFNFIDFLLNPPWQPMLLAFLVVAAGLSLLAAAEAVAAWLAGYAITWASKWAIACASGSTWSEIFSSIKFRLDGDVPNGVVEHHLFAASAKALSFLHHQTQGAMSMLILLPVLVMVRGTMKWRWFAALASTAAIPFVWFEALSNHTQIHPFTTYRPIANPLREPADFSRASRAKVEVSGGLAPASPHLRIAFEGGLR